MEPQIYIADFQDRCFENPLFFDFGRKFYPNSDLKRKNVATSVLGKILLNYAFAQNYPNCELPKLKLAEKGKPFFETEKNFHFNISHTKNRVVVAVAPFEIGVDVEFLQKCNLEIADRFFNPEESAYLKSFHSENEQNKAFTRPWTMKESCVKLLGTGISSTFDKFSVDVEAKRTHLGRNIYFETLCLECDCYVSLASEEETLKAEVHFVEIEKLLQCL